MSAIRLEEIGTKHWMAMNEEGQLFIVEGPHLPRFMERECPGGVDVNIVEHLECLHCGSKWINVQPRTQRFTDCYVCRVALNQKAQDGGGI